MTDVSRETISALMERHGQTFADEIGIDLFRNTPAPLFQLLCASILVSAPISAALAADAAKALNAAGLTTPADMLRSTWRQRTDILNKAGYARFDEKTARILEDATAYLEEVYDGDLRNLRAAANGKPEGVIARLTEFKGLGEVGAGIFLREVQAIWTEFAPWLDAQAVQGADALGLKTSADAIRDYAGDDPQEIARFVAALVRSAIAHDEDEIIHAA